MLTAKEAKEKDFRMVRAEKLLSNDFWNLCQCPGRFRLRLIKKIFPEFSLFVEKVRNDVFWR